MLSILDLREANVYGAIFKVPHTQSNIVAEEAGLRDYAEA